MASSGSQPKGIHADAKLRLAGEAEAELDGVWFYIARESGSEAVATRVIETIRRQLSILSRHPYSGQKRDDVRPGLRSAAAGNYVILYRVQDPDTLLILHILTGNRDLAGLPR